MSSQAFFSLSNWTILGLFAFCTFSPPDIQFQQPELSPGCQNGFTRMKGWWIQQFPRHRDVLLDLCPCLKQQPGKTVAPQSP